jgi:hypothetical protein
MQRRILLLSIVLALGTAGFAQSVVSNGSTCTANNAPTAGCNAGFPGFSTNAGNTGAETTEPVAAPGFVSTASPFSLMYAGANPRIVVAIQPWWLNVGSFNGHKNIGMDSSNAAQALLQAQWMKTIGGAATSVDYYGCADLCPTPQIAKMHFNLTATIALANAIAANPTTTPKFMIMLDGGSLNLTGTGQCPPAGGDQSACLIAAINTQMDYVCVNWLYQSYYEVNATNGHPIVQFFIGHGTGSNWPGTNFNTVWSGVAAHATAGNTCGSGHTYTTTVDFVDENAGAFSETGIAGAYAWPEPNPWNLSNQFCYNGTCAFNNYLGNFYSTARANPGKLAFGLLEKGFDDSNAPWGSDRVTAEQCGGVLRLTAAAIGAAGYSSSSQIQYLILATLNDYEEGTAVEPGIDDCHTLSTPSISGGTLSWTLLNSDATYASTASCSSLEIWTGTSSPTTLFASGISCTATTHAAPAPSAGQNVWVYMRGSWLIQNRLSPPLSNSSGSAAATLAEHLTTTDALSVNHGGGPRSVGLSENLVTTDQLRVGLSGTLLPVITLLGDQAMAAAGSCAFQLEIVGANFNPTSIANWNGSARQTVFFTSQVLYMAITAADLASGGNFAITVTNAGKSGNSANFFVNAGAPAMTNVALLNSTLVMDGTNFVPRNTVVAWNGRALPTAWFSATRVQAWLPFLGITAIGGNVVTVNNAGCEP